MIKIINQADILYILSKVGQNVLFRTSHFLFSKKRNAITLFNKSISENNIIIENNIKYPSSK